MSTGHVYLTRKIPEPGLAVLEASGADVTTGSTVEEEGPTRQALLEGVIGADVLLCLLTESIDRAVLEANSRLVGVAQMAVGYNNIDVGTATELGIPVTNTPGVLTDTTADCTWAMILGVARRIPEAHDYMVSGKYQIWGPNLFLGDDVGLGPNGPRKVLGIVGYGRIGAAVAKRALGFDMDVIAFDPYNRDAIEAAPHVSWADFEELLARSDFVTLHCVLTEGTRHLIGQEELGRMKESAYLINAARGPIVDEAALVTALDERQIAGAALDVYEEEPRMAEGLAECPNVLLLPHIASATRATRGKMASMAATNAVSHLRGERAPNVVNPEVYDGDAYRSRRATLLE